MRKFFTFLMLLFISTTQGQDINKTSTERTKFNSQKYAEDRSVTETEKERYNNIPELKVTNKKKALPYKVNNAESVFFPPVGDQCCCCCAQWSSHYYTFAYEMNCAHGNSASTNAYRYPSHYTFNMVNGGSSLGTERFLGWEASKSNGCPSIETFGGNCYISSIDNTKWMDGYDKYYSAMHNRTDKIYFVDVSDEDGINTLKQWLDNHADGSPNGGIANYTMKWTSPNNVLPAGTEEAGKKVFTSCSTYGHSMTCVGYNDSIRFDINNDGKYTNNIDIDGDGTVTVRDWEIGGVIIVNSGGTSWGDSGFSYLLYRVLALPNGSGICSNKMEMIRVKKNYTPLLTYKINITHSSRNKIKLTAGIATDINAIKPEFVHEFQVFNYQGGSHPMVGQGTKSTIEIGLDVSPLLEYFKNEDEVKFFLNIHNISNTGTLNSFSLMDYTGASVIETSCSETEVPLNNGITRLSIARNITSDTLSITTNSLPAATSNVHYSAQLLASGGTPPYKWAADPDYIKSDLSDSYPTATNNITPAQTDVGSVKLSLDFDFPFFNKKYNKVIVSTNGYIGFIDDSQNPTPYNKIAPFAADLDANNMFFYGNSEYATFKWDCEDFQTGKDVEFAVKIHLSGEIDIFYGNNPTIASPYVAGLYNYSDEIYWKSEYSNTSNQPNNYKFRLTPLDYPSGMSLSSGGLFEGTVAETDKTWLIKYKVSDADGFIDTKYLAFTTGSFEKPITNFESDSTDIFTSSNVQFIDLSSNAPTSWLWVFSGGNPDTSTLRNPITTYSETGSYSVKLIAINSEGSDTILKDGFIVVGEYSTTSIEKNTIDQIRISPNPTTGNFKLEFNSLKNDNYSLIITDLLGRVVYEEELYHCMGLVTKQIDLSSNSNGIYLLNIRNNNTSETYKLLLK